jgi:hypothetical protein
MTLSKDNPLIKSGLLTEAGDEAWYPMEHLNFSRRIQFVRVGREIFLSTFLAKGNFRFTDFGDDTLILHHDCNFYYSLFPKFLNEPEVFGHMISKTMMETPIGRVVFSTGSEGVYSLNTFGILERYSSHFWMAQTLEAYEEELNNLGQSVLEDDSSSDFSANSDPFLKTPSSRSLFFRKIVDDAFSRFNIILKNDLDTVYPLSHDSLKWQYLQLVRKRILSFQPVKFWQLDAAFNAGVLNEAEAQAYLDGLAYYNSLDKPKEGA